MMIEKKEGMMTEDERQEHNGKRRHTVPISDNQSM